ncbi:hypothetical protein L6R50_03685 [Myxococcota bacterium]|nr:hypothetical protein [Myxococcota bacterium]
MTAAAPGSPPGPAAAAPPRDPLRVIAAWDRDEAGLCAVLGEVLGHPFRFAGGPVPREAPFDLFARDPLGAFTRGPDGGIGVPGDPYGAWRILVEERWLPRGRPAFTRLPASLPPGPLRLPLASLLSRGEGPHDACPPHPAWPVEDRLDRWRLSLHRALLALGHGPGTVPDPAPWPGGKRFALVVTHDLDTARGQALAGAVLEEEAALGLRPSLFLPARGYRWDEGLLAAVRQAGGEIGLHGVAHDGRLPFASEDAIRAELRSTLPLLERHDIQGFRAPFLLDSEALLRVLPEFFRYDTSVPDTDTRSAVAPRRGCGTAFPCRRYGTLTVPLTLPQDDRLLQLGYRGLDLLDVLRRKLEAVRRVGAVALFNTHPEPHAGGRRVVRDLYLALFREALDAGDGWIATPGEVARHWASLDGETLGATAGLAS